MKATDAEIQAALDKLDALYGKSKAKWQRETSSVPYNRRGAAYSPQIDTIVVREDVGIGDVVHEYAHRVLGLTREDEDSGGFHGPKFIATLEDVATKFYGDARLYPNWDDEYPHITGYAYAKGYTDTPLTKSLRGTQWS